MNSSNPLIRSSSPDVSVDLIISRIVSKVSVDFLRVYPFCSAMASIKWDLVRVIGCDPPMGKKSVLNILL